MDINRTIKSLILAGSITDDVLRDQPIAPKHGDGYRR